MLMNVSVVDIQAATDRSALNISPPVESGEREVQFIRGEILKGVVEEIKSDGIISLLIKSRLLNAVSEVKVNPGQHLYLVVDRFENSMTHLRLLPAQGTAGLDDNTLSASLRSIGAPTDPDTLLIARKLLEYDLPVNRQNIAEILKATDMIGGVSSRNLETSVFALAHNVPLNKDIFPYINQFITSGGDLSRLVQDLIQLLTQMETMPRSDLPPSAAPAVVITAGSTNPAGDAVSANTAVPANAAVPTNAAVPANAAVPVNAAAPGAVVVPADAAMPTSAAMPITAVVPTDTAVPINAAAQVAVVVPADSTAQGFAGTGPEMASIPVAGQGAAGNNVIQAAPGNPVNVNQPGDTASFITQAASSGAAAATAAQIGVNTGAAALFNTDGSRAETAGGGTVSTGNPSIVLYPAHAIIGEEKAVPAAGMFSYNAAYAAAIAANHARAIGIALQPQVNLESAAPEIAAAGNAKPIDFKELVKILRDMLDSATGKITGSRPDINPVLQDLIKDRAALLDNLSRLLDMAKVSEMLLKNPAGQEFLTRVGNLHQELIGQALYNSAVRLDQEVFTNSYYFSFPIEIDKQLSYCQLRIQKNTGNKLSREDNIKLVVSLDTPALGIVIFHIDWHRQGFIQLQGIVESDEAGIFIREHMEDLLFNLNELGYKTGSLGVKTADKPEELILKPMIKETEQGGVSPFGVDVMA